MDPIAPALVAFTQDPPEDKGLRKSKYPDVLLDQIVDRFEKENHD